MGVTVCYFKPCLSGLFRLAESRSNPNLFETPVRRQDFMDDVNHLMATEATAKQLMMSKSSEDLSFI